MGITAFPRWTDATCALDSNGWTAQMAWDVADCDNELRALQADGIPTINQPHPLQAIMLCKRVYVRERPGPRFYVVAADYGMPEKGEYKDPQTVDALLREPRWRFDIGNTSEPVDVSGDNMPILNSAGDVFDPPVSRRFTTVFLTVWRYEPFYDLNRAFPYINTTNDNLMLMLGKFGFQKNQMLCLSIKPTGDSTVSTKISEIEYSFEIRYEGFTHRLLDQGYRTWFNTVYEGDSLSDAASGSGEIVDQEGTQISVPARLNGRGKPIDTTLRVTKKKYVAHDNPTPIQLGNGRFEIADNGTMFIHYDMYPRRDFSRLML